MYFIIYKDNHNERLYHEIMPQSKAKDAIREFRADHPKNRNKIVAAYEMHELSEIET